MSTLFSTRTDDVAGLVADDRSLDGDSPESRPRHAPVDSNSVRWVFAATVAFWLVVYAAGRTFF